MATYAPNDSVGNDDTLYSFSNGRSPNRYHLSRLLRKRGMRNYGEILSTLLTDSTPASSASVVQTQVDSVANTSDNVQGGVRGTTANEEVDLLLNKNVGTASANTTRVSSAADVTILQTEVIPGGSRALRKPTEANMVDLSGNGGGGKQASGR